MKKTLTLSLFAAAAMALASGCTVCETHPDTGYCPSVLTIEWTPAGNAGECPPNALVDITVIDDLGAIGGTAEGRDCLDGEVVFDIPAPGPHTLQVTAYDATYPQSMAYGGFDASIEIFEDEALLVPGAMLYDFGFANVEWSVNGGAADVSCPADSAAELLVTLDTTAELVISNQDCAVGGLSQTLPTDDGGGHGGALDLVDTSITPPPSLLATPVADTIDLPANQDDYAYNDGVVDFTTL
jgi:hypothetical protein